jgi:hypothetical protein
MPSPAEWLPARFLGGAAAESLSLLKDSPFNAIFATGAADEKPLIAAARAQGLAVVEPNGSDPSVTILKDPVWPQVAPQQGGGDAGPTGSPWLDSNGWAIQLAQARQPGRVVWVPVTPPEKRTLRTEHYLIALADAAMYGARWPVVVHDELRTNAAEWKKVCDAARFFEVRRAENFSPVVRLGICSTFTGPNEDLANEALNLSARRLLPYRVIERDKLTAASLKGLQGLLWIDEKAPIGSARQVVDKFVRAGGLLILPASAAAMAGGLKPAARQPDGYAAYISGAGRIAVSRQPWTDPFLLAEEAHMLLSRRHDVLRLWNAGVLMARYAENPSGRGRVEMINYAGRPMGHPTSLWVPRKFRTARFTALADTDARTLEVTDRNPGTEVHLPAFSVYAAVDFEN